jgi:Tfp pilus assembly protein PilZ
MKLRIHHPKVREFAIPLEDRGFFVGREGGRVDLELNWDARVSRRHVRVWPDTGTFWFEDLGSRNGTWLGPRRLVGAYPLIEGVTITVGESELTLVGEEEPEHASIATGEFEPLRLGLSPETRALLAAAKPDDTLEIIVLPPELDDFISEAQISRDLVSDLLPPSAAGADSPGGTPLDRVPVAPSDPPGPSVPPPKFVDDDRVLFALPSRAALADVWSAGMSKGALFVPCPAPPPRGRRVHVLLDAPDGAIELAAEVVHVVEPADASDGVPAGVGLHLDLGGPTRSAVQRYVDRLVPGLSLADGSAPSMRQELRAASREDIDRGLARVRALIAAFEDGDIYGGLDVPPTANATQLARRVTELRVLFGELEPLASPPQLARISAAGKLLDRAEAIINDPDRRLEHDFRQGEVRAEARIRAARDQSGPSLAVLREAWKRALPERYDKALVLTREAVAAKKSRDLLKAARLARAALDLDPFHDELRRAAEAWSQPSFERARVT